MLLRSRRVAAASTLNHIKLFSRLKTFDAVQANDELNKLDRKLSDLEDAGKNKEGDAKKPGLSQEKRIEKDSMEILMELTEYKKPELDETIISKSLSMMNLHSAALLRQQKELNDKRDEQRMEKSSDAKLVSSKTIHKPPKILKFEDLMKLERYYTKTNKVPKISLKPIHTEHPIVEISKIENNPLIPENLDTSSNLKSLLENLRSNIFTKSNFGSSKYHNTRAKLTELYLTQLNDIRHDHPFLKEDKVYNHLAEVLRTVNSGKVTLLGIDCHPDKINGLPSQIGISIYHPEGQTSIIPDIKNVHIQIADYLVGSDEKMDEYDKPQDTFLAGNSIIMKEKDARKFIESLFQICFHDNKPIKRPENQSHDDFYIPKAALVSHQYRASIQGLKNLGVTFPEELTVLDTHDLYTCTHGNKPGTTTLSTVNKRFGTVQSFLNNAGNDAYFTMILLLRLTDPAFRKAHKLDDYEEDLNYERHWLEDLKKLKKAHFSPEVFGARDPRHWSEYQFSPPVYLDRSIAALRLSFKKQYR